MGEYQEWSRALIYKYSPPWPSALSIFVSYPRSLVLLRHNSQTPLLLRVRESVIHRGCSWSWSSQPSHNPWPPGSSSASRRRAAASSALHCFRRRCRAVLQLQVVCTSNGRAYLVFVPLAFLCRSDVQRST